MIDIVQLRRKGSRPLWSARVATSCLSSSVYVEFYQGLGAFMIGSADDVDGIQSRMCPDG